MQKMPLVDYQTFEWVAKREDDYYAELRVLSVHQLGDAANVALAFGTEWFDFHNLLKIEGEWKIINKSASHQSR
jgi:Putative lumazine-binding